MRGEAPGDARAAKRRLPLPRRRAPASLAPLLRAAASSAASPLRSFVLAASRVTTSSSPFRSRSSRSRPTRAFTAALCAHSRLRTRVLERVELAFHAFAFLGDDAVGASVPVTVDWRRTEYAPRRRGWTTTTTEHLSSRRLFPPPRRGPRRLPGGSKVRSARRSARTRRTRAGSQVVVGSRSDGEVSAASAAAVALAPLGEVEEGVRAVDEVRERVRGARGRFSRPHRGKAGAVRAAVRSCLFLAVGVTHRSTRSGSTPLARARARLTTSRDSVRRSLGGADIACCTRRVRRGCRRRRARVRAFALASPETERTAKIATRAPKAGRSRRSRRRPTIAAARGVAARLYSSRGASARVAMDALCAVRGATLDIKRRDAQTEGQVRIRQQAARARHSRQLTRILP